MWKILKTEISYYKTILIIAYSIVLILQIDGLYGKIGITMAIVLIVYSFINSESQKERRNRFHVSLPIPIRQLSIIHLLIMLFFQSGMFIIWLLIFLKDHFGIDNAAIWSMLYANAFTLIVIYLLFIFNDLGFYGRKKYRIYFIIMIAFVLIAYAMLLYFGYMRSLFVFGSEFSKSPLEALISNLILFGTFYLAHVVFVHRKLFLN